MKFKDVFTPPFKLEYPMIFDAEERISLTATCKEEYAIKFIDKLNGTLDKKLKKGNVIVEGGEVYFNHPDNAGPVKIFLIRGWGRLTGTGGLRLSPEEAAKLQDDFGEYIVNKLNN